MSKNPFDPSSPFYELLRRERERAELLRRATSPLDEIYKRMKLLDGPLAQIGELQRNGTLGHAFAAMNRSAEIFQSLDRSAEIFRALDSKIFGTIKVLEANKSVFEAVMATERWRDQFKPLTELLASTEIASFGVAGQAGSISGQNAQVFVAHQLLETIGQANTPEQGANAFKKFLGLVASIYTQIADNTVDAARRMDAFTIFFFACTLVSLINPLLEEPDKDLTPAEQQAFSEVRTGIEMLREGLEELQALGLGASEAYISSLPRAELVRPARIRSEPNGKAGIVSRAQVGTPLAVVRSEGRWKLVAYRDPLNNQLSQGWIYGDAVKLLNELTTQEK